MHNNNSFLGALAAIVGGKNVLTGEGDTAPYTTDSIAARY